MRVSANKSPFVKGGFRGNVNTDSRKKENQSSPLFPRIRQGLDGAAEEPIPYSAGPKPEQ